MRSMATLADLYTVSDLESMPENGNRYEVIEGELFVSTAPSYWHQDIISFLLHILRRYLDDNPVGQAVIGPGVIFDDHNGVIPDLVYTSNEQLALILKEGKLRAAPDIVVEVLSPGSANEKRDRDIRKRLYSTRGVREYGLPRRGSTNAPNPDRRMPSKDENPADGDEIKDRCPARRSLQIPLA